MSQPYPHGHGHGHDAYLLAATRATTSGPSSNGLSQASYPQLPHRPLVPANYLPANDHNAFQSRDMNLMMTSQPETSAPSEMYAVYAPTSNVYYNANYGSANGSPQTYPPPQQSQMSRPVPAPTASQPQFHLAMAATSRSLPDIAPMPPRNPMDPIGAFGNDSALPISEERTAPQHVVGAQGRRGILPSTHGRPPAVVGASPNGQKAGPLPLKDKEGKFPCPHCEKHYLHAKHLKRHLLRHTGVRPYVCGLCNDTFSRSDILKRHFVKCSSRRGNPTGQNHLEYSRRKKAREQQEAESTENGTPTVADNAQMANLTPTSMDGSFDITALTLNQSNYGDQSNQVSRSNSVTRSNRGAESHSNRVSIGMMTAPGYESGGYAPSTGHATPDSITTSGAATPYHFSHEQRPTQLPESGSFPPSSHADPSIAAFSRAPTSSHFNGTALPHIVGHEYGRGFSMEWPHFPPHNTHDEYGNEQHPSGTNTPLEHNKPDSGYSNIPLPNLSYLSHRS